MVWTENHTAKHNPMLHAGFWVAWVLFFTLLQSLGQGGSSLPGWFVYYLITLPVFVIHTYLIAYWLVPKVFLQKRYMLFAAGVFLLLVVFSIIEMVLSNEFIFKLVYPSATPDSGYLNVGNVIVSGIGNHYIILVFIAIKIGKAWYHAQNIEEEEKQRNLEASIEIYSYQFRPRVMHRLMVLLECAIQNDIKKSPDLIISISSFLSAFLKENGKQKVWFSEEISLIKMYLEIFSTALPGRIRTEFTTAGDFTSLPVPCYLFLPVVDYALSLGKWCNSSCNCSVFVKEEDRHLCFSLNFSCEKKIDRQKNIDTEMLHRRLQQNSPGKVSLIEKIEDTNWKLEANVFFL